NERKYFAIVKMLVEKTSTYDARIFLMNTGLLLFSLSENISLHEIASHDGLSFIFDMLYHYHRIDIADLYPDTLLTVFLKENKEIIHRFSNACLITMIISLPN